MTLGGAWRHGLVGLALGVTAGLGAAALITWRATVAQRYWAAGYHRLLLAELWDRFDWWGPILGGAALAAAALAGIRRPRGPRLLRASIVLLGLVALGRGLGALDALEASRGPNVLLISVDTLRADHLGAYGYPLPTSPTLDARLASEGVTFEDVYSQSPKTTPSHMTILTSLYPCVHGIELWDGEHPGNVLSPAVHTLAEVLRNAGYATGAFTGGAHMEGARGFTQGFQIYKDEGFGRQFGQALSWMTHHRRRKFFLFFHTYRVHDPYVHPDRYIRLFDPDYEGPILDTVRRLRHGTEGWADMHRIFWQSVDASNPREVRFVEHLYDAGIRRMDAETLAPLLDRLDTLGLAANTLIVFTSDHGEAFGEHGAFQHEDLYAGTLRVPLILRWPGHLPAGVHVPVRVRSIDIMPTILDLLGLVAPPDVQGRSLVPLPSGGRVDEEEPGAVSEWAGSGLESVRWRNASYIVNGAVQHLFTLDGDASETRDIARTEPETVAAMRARLSTWHESCARLTHELGPRGDTVLPSPATLRQLRALGYVQ